MDNHRHHHHHHRRRNNPDSDDSVDYSSNSSVENGRKASGGGGGGGSHAHVTGSGNGSRNPSSSNCDVPLLGGEKIEGVYNDLTYLCPYSVPGATKGSLTVTNYKLYFKGMFKESPLILDVPLGFVSRVEKMGGQRTSGENAYGLEIFCKDIRSLRFALSKSGGPDVHPRKDIFETLRQHCFPLSYDSERSLFAFQFQDRYAGSQDGWRVYDQVAELRRQGLPNEAWKISRVNENYEICDTYPRILGLPALVTEDTIRDVAKFRSRGRFPVLSWMHPDSLATICRCAQPLVGVGKNRNRVDEKYVQMIMDANAQSHRIIIMDARPKVNAIANIVNGGGYEHEEYYTHVELVFLDIHNIHVMRESLRKVRDMCFPVIDDNRWLSNVENTHWLDYVSSILTGAVRIAGKVEHSKTSVIVHCSDGWDRTAQLTSLAMLLLDPYYRTLVGFQVLIEKEWLSFGHKFAQRIGHGEDKPNDNDRSPVFLQFIDCVWQVTNQFPFAFEFNEYFMTFILDHLYSCLFGTFLYNSDKERRQNGVKQHTKSLWSFVNSRRDMFLNPSYDDGRNTKRTIFPDPTVRYMKLWTGYYCRWNPRMRPQDSVRQKQTQNLSLKEHLKTKVETLRKELEAKRKVKDEAPSSSSNNAAAPASSSSGNNGNKDGGNGSGNVGSITKYDSVNI